MLKIPKTTKKGRYMEHHENIKTNVKKLFHIFPENLLIRKTIEENWDRISDLIEIVVDLGRQPVIRYLEEDMKIMDCGPVELEDLEYITSNVGKFDNDNRSGIEGTLHRISCFKNRSGTVIGITARVGRAIYGSIDVIKDLLDTGKSVLLVGRPGVGKTTRLRDAARYLSQTKRVVVVDTSNEIGGDGNVPHPGIGDARRMMVPKPEDLAFCMVNAVENATPQVIITDEIGHYSEAAAARTIAERGVQIIATAHGNELNNIVKNPTLSDLVGGVTTVTLSDDESRRRGTQKAVQERKAPPTFDILVELHSRTEMTVYSDVASAVDALIRGKKPVSELRSVKDDGDIEIMYDLEEDFPAAQLSDGEITEIALYGIDKDKFNSVVVKDELPFHAAGDLRKAHAAFITRAYARSHPNVVEDIENAGIPVIPVKGNTKPNISKALADLISELS